MNNLGGYITNEKIVQDMTGESLPIEDIQVLIGTKPCRGDLSRMIGRYKELNDDREYGLNYFHDGIRYKVKKEESEGGEEILKVFKSNSENEKTLMVIGDSFRLRLEKYMPYRYQKTIFVRIDDFDQELLDKYEPDAWAARAIVKWKNWIVILYRTVESKWYNMIYQSLSGIIGFVCGKNFCFIGHRWNSNHFFVTGIVRIFMGY